jgi:hypothetical protein
MASLSMSFVGSLNKKMAFLTSFRRAVPSTNAASVPSVIVHPPKDRDQLSCENTCLKFPSSGIPELDVLLLPGGGMLPGSLFSVFSDELRHFSGIFRDLFVASSIYENTPCLLAHSLVVAEYLFHEDDASFRKHLWTSLPSRKRRTDPPLQEQRGPSDVLTIAWRYRSLASKEDTSSQSLLLPFFDLAQKTLHEEFPERFSLLWPVLTLNDDSEQEYASFLLRVKDDMPRRSRVVVDLSHPSMHHSALYLWLIELRHIIQQKEHILMIFWPSEGQLDPSVRSCVAYTSDILFSLEQAPEAYFDARRGKTSVQGLLKLKKPFSWAFTPTSRPRLASFLPSTNALWQVVQEKHHIYVQPCSLPPDLSREEAAQKTPPDASRSMTAASLACHPSPPKELF